MKIDLIHYAAPPVVGGVESVMGRQARLMANAGHDVRLLAGRGSSFDDRVLFVHIPLADSRHPEILDVKRELDHGIITNQYNELVTRLLNTLCEMTSKTDILIAHNVCSLNKNLPLTAALRELIETNRSLHLILWHHDLAWGTPRYLPELHEGRPWNLLRTDWPQAIQVTISAVRQRELADLLEIPLDRIHVIPNGLDITQFLKLETQTGKLIEQLELLTADPILLLPVRITPRKNIELALRILAALRREFPRAAIVVTGPLGPHNPANVQYFKDLCSLRGELGLEKAAHFLTERAEGYLSDQVVSDFYRIADALLLPSREEGFGIPVLEAGLSGMPIFCADIPPLRELGGRDILYFPVDADPVETARLIHKQLTENPAHRLRVRVRQQYSWEQIYQDRIAPLLVLE